ncbi:ATP-dependent RNA helicase Mak5 [Schizosaccharomyces pombe]|uniref:ATP-dependent RNA helicase mak5 n=1 Tax=Schizosaccharomyces pombe (strain 972 / ATCC 24843) TaxID=284812 RepID=MAK5_SCHPO|nr:putative ATP-dependent RNA helicase Mak5 [Schizosaccharomyces pombe]O74393.1 RecName: Full=ATP-dependent RNA helicase mak5 [Schizosaccharomyces pombe 972h-]CAA20727.1 ATP-dependent RNA helicase Mak5 (predicted) [Schizosaccharomyces pombe]|eukprot:NP_596107.1 putative ATP-dependent RNA helicase Mak5 [Schizosaccharomyces pombe]
MPKKAALDELKWKEVKLPDHLDDFDGFMGLEEIEGVDIKYQPKGAMKEVIYELPEVHEKKDKKPEKRKKDQKEASEKKKKGKRTSPTIEMTSLGSKVTSKNYNEFSTLEEEDEHNSHGVDVSAWAHFSLSPEMLGSLSKAGFSKPMPIQSLVIPEASIGFDIIGKADTGSGKTLAFGIPILEHCLRNVDAKYVQALVVAPTRELAHQICQHFELIKPSPNIRVMSITGGLAVQKQQRLLNKHPHVVVATPGRLWSVINENNLTGNFKKIKCLVLDEADRLLQKSHFEELSKLLEILGNPMHTQRQTFIFSATFDEGLQQRLKKNMKGNITEKYNSPMENMLKEVRFFGKPKFLDANPQSAVASRVLEGLIECAPAEKDLYLYYLIMRYPGKTMVFANGIEDIKRITPFLNELKVPSYPLHAQLDQKKRLQSLEKFKNNPKGVLVCTDVAARGIDIPSVTHVIHYHVPHTADMYVHRSGRTARANEDGVSILMCGPKELSQLKRLCYRLKKKIETFINFPVDMSILDILKTRVVLAHKIVNLTRKDGRVGREEAWLKSMAQELGVESSDDEDPDLPKKSESSKNKKQIAHLRSELAPLLHEKIRTGFSGRYLTSGLVNMAEKLANEEVHDNIIGMDSISALEVLQKRKK